MRHYDHIEEANMEEIINIIQEEAIKFKNEASKCAFVTTDYEIKDLLEEENLNRFLSITKAISFPLKDYDYEVERLWGTNDPIEETGRLMQSWITLGSAVESSLQIFLAVYLYNYQQSKWGMWNSFNYEVVKTKIYEALDNVPEADLSREHKKSLKKSIKGFLQGKEEINELEELNLNNLLAFFDINVWQGENNFTEGLDKIRQYRNCVHSFKSRDIGEWDMLLDSLKVFAILLIHLYTSMPDADSMLDYYYEMQSEMRSNNYD